jgi:hypothetical protein
MDAVHRTDLDARVVLDADARFSDDIRHRAASFDQSVFYESG